MPRARKKKVVRPRAEPEPSDEANSGSDSDADDALDALRVLVGQTLTKAQLDLIRTYRKSHGKVNWYDINKQSKQLGHIIRKMRKTGARLSQADFRIIATTAPPRHLSLPLLSSCDSREPRTGGSCEEEQVHTALHAAGTSSGDTHAFLKSLGALDKTLLNQCTVVVRPLAYRDAVYKSSQPYRSAPFQVYGTLSALTHPRVRRPFTIALLSFPCKPLLGMTAEEAAKVEWHANVAVIVDAEADSQRDLVVFEPNITAVEARETTIERIFQPWMVHLLRSKQLRPRVGQLWVNNERPKRNNSGICLQLAMEWMVELVAGGLQIDRDRSGNIVAIGGFRSVDM
ncbi:hypothetical protein C8F01DRAFT_1379052 [Mycena amicta]|nr:hypothetical protein C8F01DRAFT_1379052 [Mycena amicta]